MHAPTIEEVMQPFIGYPKVIQQAIFRAETHPAFSVLTKSGKKVLKQLLTRANKDNAAEPIRVRLSRVADASGVHYRTAQRVMRLLNELGWVTRITDGRGRFGMFSSNQYRLSADLCKLLCLEHEGLKNNTNAAQMSDGSYNEFFDLNFKKDQLEICREKQKTNPITLPAELLEIAKLGVKESGICKLRGHAHQRGHKLEDIWQVARDRLAEIGARGNRVYRYLLSMIAKDSDYKGRAGQVGRLTVAPPIIKPSEQVQKVIKQADDKLREQVKHLPKGRAANIGAMLQILKNKNGERIDAEDARDYSLKKLTPN